MAKASVTIPIRMKAKDGDKGENGNNAVCAQISPSVIAYKPGEVSIQTVQVQINDGGTLTAPTSLVIVSSQDGMECTSSSLGANAASYNLKFNATATISGNVRFWAPYNGKTYYAYLQIMQLEQGDPGPAGVTYRQSEWASGIEYHNDTALLGTQDICYVDIVVQKDSYGKVSKVHKCLKTHTSDADNRPSDSSSEYWERFSTTGPIYTPIIMAEDSVIGFMQGNSLKIFNSDTRLKAGVVGASGDYPVFYASPRSIPIKTKIFFAATATTSSDDAEWGEGFPSNDYGSSNPYLWVKVLTRFSNGYEGAFPSRIASFSNTGSITHYEVEYATCQYYRPDQTPLESVINPLRWNDEMYPPDENYPQLIARVILYYGTSRKISYITCGQYSASQDTATSLFQVLDSGKTKIGEPKGARIELNPNYGAGGVLPRMEVYDTDSVLSTIFDGSKITGSSDIYSTSASDTTSSMSAITDATATVGSSYTTSVSTATTTVTLCTLSTSAVGFLDVEAITPVTVTTKRGNFTGDTAAYLTEICTIDMLVDGRVVASQSVTPTSTTATTTSCDLAAVSTSVGNTGSNHKVELRIRMVGYAGAEAKVSIAAKSNAVHFYASRYISRYFANGLCLGSADNNHFLVYNGNSGGGECMVMQFRNSAGYGLKIGSDGIKVWNGTTWRTANI